MRSQTTVLRTLAVGAIAVGFAATGLHWLCEPQVDEFKEFDDKLGITVAIPQESFVVEAGDYLVTGKGPKRSYVKRYTPLLFSELSIYPLDLITKCEVRRIVLCAGLSLSQGAIAAVSDLRTGTLYLDVRRGSHDRAYQRLVIHHELFHFVDYRDNGLFDDEQWAKLNSKDFKYGNGGHHYQDDVLGSRLTDSTPGILTNYSMSGIAEDKAELFANLIVNPAYVRRRATRDVVIESKVKAMKELLLEFSWRMDDSFWESVAARNANAHKP